jgi:hypothetical protein
MDEHISPANDSGPRRSDGTATYNPAAAMTASATAPATRRPRE